MKGKVHHVVAAGSLVVLAACGHEDLGFEGRSTERSFAPLSSTTCSGEGNDRSCTYTGNNHPLLASNFYRIGLTLCSDHFPVGSDEREAVEFAIGHINNIPDCKLSFYIAGTESHTNYGGTLSDDGVNKLDFVDTDDCECTDCVFDGRTVTWEDGSGYINEFDIAFDEAESWFFGSPQSWLVSDPNNYVYFRTVILHELSHGIGFEHLNGVTGDLSIMGASTGKWIGNKKVGFKAWDYGHIRAHYGDTADGRLADLVLSNYRTESNGSGGYDCVLNEGLSDFNVTAGQTVTLTWTRMNIGDRAASNDFVTRVYLSEDSEIGSSDDEVIKSWTLSGGVAAHSTLYASTSLTIPASTPAGTYYVGLVIDDDGSIAEHNNNNNTLVIHTTLVVN